MSQWKTKGVII